MLSSEKIICCYVVLHYKAYVDTISCVNSILKQKSNHVRIIIVDNGSNDGSFEMVKSIFEGESQIEYIHSPQNLGFAKGNNLGMLAAKTFSPNYIITLNNDTEIITANFLDNISKIFQQTRFAVLGPKIINESGCNQNPMQWNLNSKEKIRKHICYLRYNVILCNFKIEPIVALVRKILKTLKKKNSDAKQSFEGNLKLHGACWIFSKLFFDYEDGIIDSTFLYGEEDFLSLLCSQKKYEMFYSDRVAILHKESRSTKTIYKGMLRRHKFYYENALKSALLYEKYFSHVRK